ncbi:hypothetical protein [Pseudomonas sp. 5P_3.1_Bac2]|uniref:hypothetical protein n=1 Tax=Pseudomonas sp. 5P_3.1_Bac2 TaxID=2971617 RepID=UPI0021CADA89|nr:hypothetical protein [Pseudomonas sp. 5P_3.1_Bac2]MCU1718123.1 hypothetical protein [Pseudomonas sp. 5P_3.1_Bac2]
MKKITLIVAGLLSAGAVHATTFDATGPYRMTDCELLNENVTITLSANVRAGVVCTVGTGVAVGTCHTGGRTAAREVEILVASTDPNATPGTLVSQNPPVFETRNGPVVATASTRQGTVVPLYPQGQACTAAIAETQATARLTQ